MATKQHNQGSRKVAEIRVEVPDEHLAVLDAYCSASSESRTDVIKELLAEWSKQKFHEATLILRVAGRNPATLRSESGQTGG